MSQKPSERDLIPFKDARLRAGHDLLPYARLNSWIRYGSVYSPPGQRTADGQRLVDYNELRPLVADAKEAMRLGRTSTEPFIDRDETTWLPIRGERGILRRKNGFKFKRSWLLRRSSQVPCKIVGKKLGKLFYAKTHSGAWRWVLFIPEDDILAIESHAAEPKVPTVRKGYVRKPLDKPNRKKWASNDRAMKLLGLEDPSYLYYIAEHGFTLPDGKTIKPKSRRFRVKRSNGWAGQLVFWSLRQIKRIAKYREAQNRGDRSSIYEPFTTTDGVVRLRDRAVFKLFKDNKLSKPHDTTWKKWTGRAKGGLKNGCPALGGAVIDWLTVPSIASTKSIEGASSKDQIVRLIVALKRTPAEMERYDFVCIEGDVFLPQHLARKYVPYRVITSERHLPAEKRSIKIIKVVFPYRHDRDNWETEQDAFREADLLRHPEALRKTSLHKWKMSTEGNPAGDDCETFFLTDQKPQLKVVFKKDGPPAASPPSKPKAGGRPPVSPAEETRRRAIYAEWLRRAGRCSRKEFCDDKKITVRYLEKCQDFVSKRDGDTPRKTG